MWREVTENDVLNVLNGAELAAYRRVVATKQATDGDVLTNVINLAVQQARGHIADCAKNKLAAGNTVPDRVIMDLLSIIRFQLLTRLAMRSTDERELEYKQARRFFERVSECKVSIEYPAGMETEETGNVSSIEVANSSPRLNTRNNLKGL